MRVILINSQWEKYPLANIRELESCMSHKHVEKNATGLTSLLVEKVFAKLITINFESCFHQPSICLTFLVWDG